ncbi:permease [Candidatus Tenderia electrophaga]|jgi:putative permease|uniref:Permease n=1 Tax=Candidatus Tenderia electrophaga TaxID=1748243 RepID=A0A0S2TB63_9GAMM|nr:permease [Candidatus Tenderia electrophaga]
MENVLGRWFKKYFSDPEGVILAVLLILGFTVVIFFGDMLAPVLASVVIAYLLEGVVRLLENHGMGRLSAVMLVFLIFLTFLLFVFLGLVPLLSKQVAQLVQEIPNMVSEGQRALLRLPELYPHIFSEAQVNEIMTAIRSGLTEMGQNLLSFSLASISTLFTMLVYLVLLPVLVFFFMKDKHKILDWITRYMPRERGVALRVWREMDRQIGNYVRGKFAEIMIVGLVSYVVFALMGLQYASLLGAAVGLSVVVPYIGAVVVTAPVLLIGFFQWGWGADFAYLALAYLIIQAVDGNVLVPWLFSEAVNLHPIAIIVAILIFGGVWGFWGIFFAIPLATLVKAVIDAWPKLSDTVAETPDN